MLNNVNFPPYDSILYKKNIIKKHPGRCQESALAYEISLPISFSLTGNRTQWVTCLPKPVGGWPWPRKRDEVEVQCQKTHNTITGHLTGENKKSFIPPAIFFSPRKVDPVTASIPKGSPCKGITFWFILPLPLRHQDAPLNCFSSHHYPSTNCSCCSTPHPHRVNVWILTAINVQIQTARIILSLITYGNPFPHP